MKVEKNRVLEAEALQKVKGIIDRIEKEKAELKNELEKVEYELNAKTSGTIKESGFNIKKVLENDGDETTERLKLKVKKIKSALAKPYYADEEFRKYSIIYLKGNLEEHQEERKKVNEEIGDLRHELIVIPQKIHELEKKRIGIIDNFSRKFTDIGLRGETEGLGLYGAEFVLSRYEDRCNEYENN